MNSSDNRRMDGTKLLWHMDRVQAHFKDGARVAPVHIDMGIAKFCNVNCVFCFGKFQNPDPVYIKKEALMETIRGAAQIGVKSIGFIGDGEPTCNPAVYDALEYGQNLGIDMAISTNGVLLNSDEKRLSVLRSCSWMRFCFSAGTRYGYLQIHGKDRFDQVVDNIRKMVWLKKKYELKCDIGLQAVFVPTMMKEEIIEESRLAVDLGVDYLVIKQCSLPKANESVGDVKFDVEMYDSNEIQGILKICEAYSTEKTKIIPKWETLSRKGQRLYEHCPAVPLISEISGNGDWFPCGYFFGNKPEYEKYKFGNVHDKSLIDIYYSDHYWDVINHFRESFDSHTECSGSCRLDACNKFIADYLNVPKGINFI